MFLRKYDPQLILWFDNVDKRYKILRQPEKYGDVPREGYSDAEIRKRLKHGSLLWVMTIEHNGKYAEPGDWVIDRLRAMDVRARPRYFLHEIEAGNERKLAKENEGIYENIRYAVRQDWRHIRDELRGDTLFRKYVVSKPVE